MVTSSPKPTVKKRILAFLCRVCPFCIAARRYPNSTFARKLKEAEKNCPACKAYYELVIAGEKTPGGPNTQG